MKQSINNNAISYDIGITKMVKSDIVRHEDYVSDYGDYLSLWLAVVYQAIIDLKSKSKKSFENRNRKEALAWMDLNNENFLYVCNLAELNPQVVYDKKLQIMRGNPFLKKEYKKELEKLNLSSQKISGFYGKYNQ